MTALDLCQVLQNRSRGLLTVRLVRDDDYTGESVVVEDEACAGWKRALEYARHLRWQYRLGRRTSRHRNDSSLRVEVVS